MPHPVSAAFQFLVCGPTSYVPETAWTCLGVSTQLCSLPLILVFSSHSPIRMQLVVEGAQWSSYWRLAFAPEWNLALTTALVETQRELKAHPPKH